MSVAAPVTDGLVSAGPAGGVTVLVGLVADVPVVLAASVCLVAEVVAGAEPVGLPVMVGTADVPVEVTEVGEVTAEVPVTVLDFS